MQDRDTNHPKFSHLWETHFNELLGRGRDYHLHGTLLKRARVDFIAQLGRARIEANRLARRSEEQERLSKTPEDAGRLRRRAEMWRSWSNRLLAWQRDPRLHR